MVYTYLITGANKGIGLAIVEELVKKDDVKVIATTRSLAKATDLKRLAEKTNKVEIVELDVSSRDSIDKLVPQLEKVSPEGIDFLIGNAAVASLMSNAIDVPYEEYMRIFNTNLFGYIYLIKALFPFLLKKDTRKVALTSSSSGSLTHFLSAQMAPYGMSKASLNFLTKSLALEHKEQGFTFVSIHPGFVETALARDFMQNLTPEQLEFLRSAKPAPPLERAILLVKVYDSLTIEDSGRFIKFDGTDYPL